MKKLVGNNSKGHRVTIRLGRRQGRKEGKKEGKGREGGKKKGRRERRKEKKGREGRGFQVNLNVLKCNRAKNKIGV